MQHSWRMLKLKTKRIMDKNYLAYKLKEYVSSGILPMHMPGHKRRVPKEIYEAMTDIYNIDLTEVEGTDNLHDALGIIKESIDFAKKIYNSDESFYLINGSSCGILAGIRACAAANGLNEKKSYILVAENAHFSVFNAIELMNLIPIYIEIQVDEMGIAKECDIERLKEILETNIENNIVAAVITSPTYEGVVSDIGSIANILHQFNIPLIVDEAHGAHLIYIENTIKKYVDLDTGNSIYDMKFPISATRLGADIVVQSLHKTLPSLTQTAICHLNSGLIQSAQLAQALHIFETSSPSYIFMSAIDACIRYMYEHDEYVCNYLKNLSEFRKSMDKCNNIHLWCGDFTLGYDFTKLVIYSDLLDGMALAEILRDIYNIETEMSQEGFVLAYSSVCDCEEDFFRLKSALLELDRNLKKEDKDVRPIDECSLDRKYLGSVANGNIYIYPPGVPIVRKNELIDQDKFDLLEKYIKKGKRVYGLDL